MSNSILETGMRRCLSMSFLLIILISGVLSGTGAAQGASAPVAAPAGGREPANYVLGPKDTLSIWAREPAEVNSASARIDGNGFVNLPLVERIQAAGLTVDQFRDELITKLKKYVVNPQVIVNIVGFRAILVSIVGAVANPGAHDLTTSKGGGTLIDMIQSAQPRSDASTTVRVMRKIERGELPVANVSLDPSGKYNVADIDLKAVIDGHPEVNIPLMEDDQVILSQSPIVYIAGEVVKQGSITADPMLGGVYIMQAVAQAGGLAPTAKAKNAKIMRNTMVGSKPKQIEIAIDVEKIMKASAPDQKLLPNDVLFIPGSNKQAAGKVISTVVNMGTNMLTWGLIGRIP
jgi:polysaccharide export outer membrane protein